MQIYNNYPKMKHVILKKCCFNIFFIINISIINIIIFSVIIIFNNTICSLEKKANDCETTRPCHIIQKQEKKLNLPRIFIRIIIPLECCNLIFGNRLMFIVKFSWYLWIDLHS